MAGSGLPTKPSCLIRPFRDEYVLGIRCGQHHRQVRPDEMIAVRMPTDGNERMPPSVTTNLSSTRTPGTIRCPLGARQSLTEVKDTRCSSRPNDARLDQRLDGATMAKEHSDGLNLIPESNHQGSPWNWRFPVCIMVEEQPS
jgi:hypothetical protein